MDAFSCEFARPLQESAINLRVRVLDENSLAAADYRRSRRQAITTPPAMPVGMTYISTSSRMP